MRSGSFGICIFAFMTASLAGPLLSNPLVDFDSILFVQFTSSGGHMCDQYYGLASGRNGGIYIVSGFKSGAPKVTNITANSVVAKGAMVGQKLTGGGFLSPDLSYDGKTVLFAWTNTNCYHIFKVNVDGSNLVQLTDGVSNYAAPLQYANKSFNDFDPCWLPNGRIVFVSERRGGAGRCTSGRPFPTYTMYTMKDDGTDIVPISYHETNEWNPSVNNDGMIVYTRWDYLDRDDCIAHHIWTCYPDGRDPRSPGGNYPNPLQTIVDPIFDGDGRGDRPNGEWHIRAVPNSNKYVATAGCHHCDSYGHLILIDPNIPDDNKMSQIKGITTSQTSWPDGDVTTYATAWPLSEDLYLCNKNKTIILYSMSTKTEEVVYTLALPNPDGGTNRPLDPIPLKARKSPPVLAAATWQGERASLSDHKRATISVMNVNYADKPFPADRKITSLRFIQIIPQLNQEMNSPRIGYPSEALARLSLGTVPVDPDGSVYCEAPVAKEFYMQLLDEKGMAVASMRSGAFVHPGEQLTCYGCHEDKWKATPPANPTATRRAPSKLAPEPGAESNGVALINYYRLVKPVFDSKCVPCHTQQGKGPADMSYASLEPYAFHYCGGGDPWLNGDIESSIVGGSRSLPGYLGAAFSRMGKALLTPAHQARGITSEEFHRVTLWLDANSNELSAYTNAAGQKAGQLVWPESDFDPQNATGVESNYPLPGGVTGLGGKFSSGSGSRVDRLVMRNGAIEMNNPCAGPARVRVCDLAGRIVADRIFGGSRISLQLSPSRRLYYITVYGADGRQLKTGQAFDVRPGS